MGKVMKRNWFIIVVLLLLFAAVRFWVLEKEGRATDYQRCSAVLRAVFRRWESLGRPGTAGTQTMLEEWLGTRPYISTNELTVETNHFRAAFAFSAIDFGEKGTLIVTTNGVLIRVFEDGHASVVP